VTLQNWQMTVMTKKKVVSFSPSAAALGDTHPSDATGWWAGLMTERLRNWYTVL